jgi:hypothetical protein
MSGSAEQHTLSMFSISVYILQVVLIIFWHVSQIIQHPVFDTPAFPMSPSFTFLRLYPFISTTFSAHNVYNTMVVEYQVFLCTFIDVTTLTLLSTLWAVSEGSSLPFNFVISRVYSWLCMVHVITIGCIL